MSSDAKSLSTWLPTLLAALFPILAAVFTVSGLLTYTAPQDEAGLRNAGFVMNGRRLSRSVVDRMESDLAMYEPDVLVVGNSLANTSVTPALVAKALNIPAEKVVVFSVPNSITPHWYAILKNRVFGNGYNPRLIIVVGSLQTTLMNQPFSPSSYQNLLAQMSDDEPVIDQYVEGDSNEMVSTLRTNRLAVRDRFFARLGNTAVGLVFRERQPGIPTREALERVFHHSKVNNTLHKSMMPVQGTRSNVSADAKVLPTPETSMMPLLSQLVTENGGKMAVVRCPMSPRTPLALRDNVLPGTSEAMGELLAADGNMFIDLYGMRMRGTAFEDLRHMTEDGALKFTKEMMIELRIALELDPPRRKQP